MGFTVCITKEYSGVIIFWTSTAIWVFACGTPVSFLLKAARSVQSDAHTVRTAEASADGGILATDS